MDSDDLSNEAKDRIKSLLKRAGVPVTDRTMLIAMYAVVKNMGVGNMFAAYYIKDKKLIFFDCGVDYYELLEKTVDAVGNCPHKLFDSIGNPSMEKGAGTKLIAEWCLSCGFTEKEFDEQFAVLRPQMLKALEAAFRAQVYKLRGIKGDPK